MQTPDVLYDLMAVVDRSASTDEEFIRGWILAEGHYDVLFAR
jgi:hypothetical protein